MALVVTRMRRFRAAELVCSVGLVVVWGATACAPAQEDADSSAQSTPVDSTQSPGPAETTATKSGSPTDKESARCTPEQLTLIEPGRLTVGTDSPAYEPWFKDNDPTNGEGFESAVAYAVADELGFDRQRVDWVTVPFNTSYAPGDKQFDFDINQISITPNRAEVVDFSDGYYQAAQAVIVMKGSEFEDAASLADLEGARIGAQVGTTSLSATQEIIAPDEQAFVYDDTNAAKQSLLNEQIDAIVVDLPTAFYISAVEIPGSQILGQFQPTSGETEEFGMLFEEGNPLVSCVNEALGRLRESGELERIEQKWLSQVVDAPTLD